ncbi:MAG: Radical SAM domain protein [Microgenomates group bacterium GW2011_GWB1_40_9]|nr:MAG: Radical SAM domain protein [Microgenomates group bacterium GW2011_GWC1_39_12]KKR79911.1 MAG: Radical SAM domain protein [Microgenomates group bacterium GW2011_GWB1_40_9]
MEIKEITAKSILTKTTLKNVDFDYTVNPYIGCAFGCVYCYASFMGRFVGKKNEDWGSYVFAKINAPELLAKEIQKLPDKGKENVIWFSSVTDPYQGLEAKYKLTRKCLEALLAYGYQGQVHILTKSDLLLRDIDFFKKTPRFSVGLTITSTDDDVSRYFEKFAPPVSVRLKALRTLKEAGLHTYAFVGPLLPHILTDERALDQLFNQIAETGNTSLVVEYFNASPYILKRLEKELKGIDEKTIDIFRMSNNKEYRLEWDERIKKLVSKYKLVLAYGGALYHPEMEK